MYAAVEAFAFSVLLFILALVVLAVLIVLRVLLIHGQRIVGRILLLIAALVLVLVLIVVLHTDFLLYLHFHPIGLRYSMHRKGALYSVGSAFDAGVLSK